jgi:two-component system LytT family sensor kinase
MKLRNIEITLASLLLLFFLFDPITLATLYYGKGRAEFADNFTEAQGFRAHGLHFDFIIHYFMPVAIEYLCVYLSFFWIAAGLPNKYVTQRQIGRALLLILPAFILIWFALVFSTWLARPYEKNIVIQSLFDQFKNTVIIYLLLVIYQVVKQSVIWFLVNKRHQITIKQKNITTDSLTFLIIWIILTGAAISFHLYWGFATLIAFVFPCAYIVYAVNLYWLIPAYYKQGRQTRFWVMEITITFLINIPFNGGYCSNAAPKFIPFLILFLFIWGVQLLLLIPLSLFIYHYRTKQQAELTGLRTNLGASTANLQFLRSQINPHFLFNALNTLYGTALMENAERTGEGIQKLGDMMRFMLHENIQDKIALSREIDYLQNYISLQNLRIASSPQISIEVQIAEIISYHDIAPMLLIPFVENAYKHGISFRERSWINISLYLQDDTLHFDLHNSIHPDKEDDPERQHSGIGLENVKQRLQVLYPNKHELVIRHNTKEFFIHLTMNLK